MVLQLVEDFVHLECGENRLHQDRRADRAAGDAELVLREVEDVVPEARLEVALELGQVEVGARPLRDERRGVVIEEEAEVEEAGRNRAPVHGHVLLVQMPAARPHHQCGRPRRERVALPLGAGELDGAAHRVPEVQLPLEVVAPGRGVRVFEIRHVDPRTRIQRVDDHLAVHGTRDLDPAVRQVRGDRRDRPRGFAHRARLAQEVGKPTGVEAPLPLHATRKQLLAAPRARPRQRREKAARLGGQDFDRHRHQGRVHFEPGARPRLRRGHDRQCGGRVRSGCARPLRQPARCQRLPSSAFAGFFPPTSACCFRRLGIATVMPCATVSDPHGRRGWRTGTVHAPHAWPHILWQYYRTCVSPSPPPLPSRPSAAPSPVARVSTK